MRALTPEFAAHLASGATTLATCWRIARRDGEVFRFTDHNCALTLNGETYSPTTGGEGAAMSASADLAVDNTEVVGLLASDALDAGALMSGRFDEAAVEIWRVNWADPSEALLLRCGVIGEVKRDGARFTAEIRGLSHRLDEVRGRVYQRACDANAGDARCGVNLDDAQYMASGAVTAVTDDGRFSASGLDSFASGWFAHGRLDWTSGANAGTRAHVKAHAGAAISLWIPAGALVAIGDTFEVRAGCDKAFATCRAKFSNAVNFRGFHLMPGADFIIQIAAPGGANDGGRRR